jgi:hypothetical protein
MGARGRKAIVVSREELQTIINQVETNGPLASRTALYDAIAGTEWAKTREPRPLTPQVAMLFVTKRFTGLSVLTPVGKRGRSKGCPAVPNAGKRKRRKMPKEVKEGLLRIFPESLHSAVNRAAEGNMRAAVKLKCVDCSGGSKKEVALCTLRECALWMFRPYKNVAQVEKESVAHDEVGTARGILQTGQRLELPVVDCPVYSVADVVHVSALSGCFC